MCCTILVPRLGEMNSSVGCRVWAKQGYGRRAQQRAGPSERSIRKCDAETVTLMHGIIVAGCPVPVPSNRSDSGCSPLTAAGLESLQAADKSGSVGAIYLAARMKIEPAEKSPL